MSLQYEVCNRCFGYKPETEFYLDRGGRKRNGRRGECKECSKAGARKWSKDNPTRVRERWLRANYKLTPSEWEELFSKQGRACAICKSTHPKTERAWHTDHDHKTGRVRGILCYACNRNLAVYEKLKDDPNVHIYLEGASSERHDQYTTPVQRS